MFSHVGRLSIFETCSSVLHSASLEARYICQSSGGYKLVHRSSGPGLEQVLCQITRVTNLSTGICMNRRRSTLS